MRRALVVLGCCSVLAGATAPAATAGHTFRSCGLIEVGRSDYRVKSLNVSCRNAKTWMRTFLTRGRSPRGFRCRRIRSPGVRVVASCRRSENVSFYAERR